MINIVQPSNNAIMKIHGFVTEIDYDEENSLLFNIQDEFGFIRCILYSSNTDNRDIIHQKSYREITGQLRYDDDGNRFLYIYSFKKLRDMNSITHHIISIIHTNLVRFHTKKNNTISHSIMNLPDEVVRKHIIPYLIPTFENNENSIYNFEINELHRTTRDELRNYQLVGLQFWRLIHKITRTGYRYLCQIMFSEKVLPNIRYFISSTGEMYFDQTGPYILENRQIKSEGYHDPDGVAKMMTLTKEFAGSLLQFRIASVEKWLPPIIRRLEWMRESGDLKHRINCNFIQFVNRGGGAWHWDQVRLRKTIKRFADLVDTLSEGKCLFKDGLCCIDCRTISFNNSWFSNDNAACYYCKIKILPNFRCRSCINPCQCYQDVGFEEFCNSFVCNICVVERFISQEMTWISPGCANIIQ